MVLYEKGLTLSIAVVLTTLLPLNAGAIDVPCGPAEDGVIFIDGLLSDWKEVSPRRFSSPAQIVKGRERWNDKNDLSFDLRCNYSEKFVYLAIAVRDETFACHPKTSKRDGLALYFGRRILRVFPGNAKGIPGLLRWGRRKARGITMAESSGDKGWTVELKIPKRRIPGYRRGAHYIPLEVRAIDVDWRGKVDTVMSSGRTRVVVAQVVADLRAFLSSMKATAKEIRMRKQADLVGGRGVEQLVWLRKTIGLIGRDIPGGGGFFYFNLPVQSAKDIKSVRLMDLNGDRQQEIVIRMIQRGGGGWRALLVVYRFTSGNKFTRPFAHEVSKGQGGRMIDNRVSFKRRKHKGRTAGIAIVIDRPTTRGFSKENYRESKATDVHAILLPWGETQKRVFHFDGDEYSEQ